MGLAWLFPHRCTTVYKTHIKLSLCPYSHRFYFVVEENETPTQLTITPCGSLISWNVTYQEWPEDERSGDRSGSYPKSCTLIQIITNLCQLCQCFCPFLSTADQDYYSDEYADSEDFHQQEAAVRTPQDKASKAILGSYMGYGSHSFLTEHGLAGLYTLEVLAQDYDNTIRLLGTSTPHSDAPYPALPVDPSARVMSVTRNTVSVAWKASPTARQHGQPVEYCIMVNKEHNFKTACAATAYMHGDLPPTPPPHAGFGFAHEKEKFNIKSNFPLPTANPSDIFYTCVGTKTHYAFSEATPGTTYYFDVFAVNKNLNTSTTYVGASAKTKSRPKAVTLKDGKMHMAHLKRSRPKKVFKFTLTRDSDEMLISLQPCSSEITVVISNNTHVFEKTKITSLQQLRLTNVSAGVYKIKAVASRRQSTSVYVYASTRAGKNPYPLLPPDKSIKIHEEETTCTTATVSWQGTPRRQQYCLFMHRERRSSKWLYKKQNSCVDPQNRKKSGKVACRWYRSKGKQRGVLKERVTGLRPGKRYVFDVYVRRAGGKALAYQRAWVTTRSKC